ncbi:hypothetical protein EDB92DRAFT_836390 [Lactarius akahatsu]|uniref:Uncharacterized protein n=1 Tax=Lactarius akahatsu TaxID=416441 RepID=A0AAD4LES3_9AGAM|nr:hypothetical protein EDB92DRAFT_836390 [Lactarius akahatsu]
MEFRQQGACITRSPYLRLTPSWLRLSHSYRLMSTVRSPDYSPHFINGAYEVAGYHLGKGLVDAIRNSSTGGKLRNGDYFLNRSRPLIQQFYSEIPNEDQNNIHHRYQKAVGAREGVESARGFRKFFKAKEYEEVARHLFIIVETASRRVADQNLMAQISEAIAGRGAPPSKLPPPSFPPPLGTTSTLSNPFSDSHEEPSTADIDVGDLNQLEMSIFESGSTGEAAIVLELHGRDGTTQEVATTIPLEVRAGYMADEEAETHTVASFDSSGCAILGPRTEASDDAGR